MSIRPKQTARMGEFHLEEAVLDVLLEAYHEEECLGPAEISNRAGIYRKPGGGDGGAAIKNMNDPIVMGLLNKLNEGGKVRRCTQPNGSGGWMLSDEEFQMRRDDA